MSNDKKKLCVLGTFFLLLHASLYSIHSGVLDPSFGGNPIPGLQITDFFNTTDIAFGVAIQSDGKIVAVGQALGAPGGTDFALARYDTNGILDPTFGGFPAPGLVVTDFDGLPDIARAVVIQPDDKIIAVGQASVGATINFGLARYRTDGSLDETFGGDPAPGLVITNILDGGSVAQDAALQPDGKIVVVGNASDGISSYFAVARYDTDGSLDIAFGGNPFPGVTITNFFANESALAMAVALQPDGKIVAVGVTLTGVNSVFALARYNIDGSLDDTFGGNPAPGLQITDFFGGSNSGESVVLQPDGKIVVAGFAQSGAVATRDFALARYSPSGHLDATFGGNPAPGLQVTDFFNNADQANDVVLQPNGKIIAIGQAAGGPGGTNFALARYNTNGSLDVTFGGDPAPGLVITDFFGGMDMAHHAAILQSDGKLVAVGQEAGGGGGTNFGLARYFVFTPGRISALTQAIIDKYC